MEPSKIKISINLLIGDCGVPSPRRELERMIDVAEPCMFATYTHNSGSNLRTWTLTLLFSLGGSMGRTLRRISFGFMI